MPSYHLKKGQLYQSEAERILQETVDFGPDYPEAQHLSTRNLM